MKPNRCTFAMIALLVSSLGASAGHAQQTTGRIVTRQASAKIQSASDQHRSIPLLASQSASSPRGDGKESPSVEAPIAGSLITVSSSLVVVLGLFAGLVWISRKFGVNSGNGGTIPKEVLQPLGSTAIDARNRITMIRCGDRILVLSQNAQGMQPVAEITSPEEVVRLTAACLGDAKQAFASTLQSIEHESPSPGFVGTSSRPNTPRSRGRLFASA